MKIVILSTIFLVIQTVQGHGDIWSCEYDIAKFSFSNAFTMEHHKDYTCYLKSKYVCPFDVTESLDRAHYHERYNYDVKILRIYSNLKTFSSIFCETFENLEIISVKNVGVESIDEKALEKCENLNIFQFVRNEIQKVPEKFLPRDSQLIQFRIHKNLIRTLPEKFFIDQDQLKILALDKNKIVFLPAKIFHPLVNLQYLTLADNELRAIIPHWFKNLRNLRELKLQNNHITKVPKIAFEKLVNLQKLWIGSNRIKELDSNSFQGLQKLNYLNIAEAHITNLPSMVFAPMSKLNELILSNNELTIIYSDSFDINHTPAIVDLSNNQIIAIDAALSKQVDSSMFNISYNLCTPVVFQIDERFGPRIMYDDEETDMNETKSCYQKYEPRPKPTKVLINDTGICGKRENFIEDNHSIDLRIIDGINAKHGEYPWAAVLRYSNDSYFCGGTLISNRKIVTAAHCLFSKKANKSLSVDDFYVLLGAHDLNVENEIGRSKYSIKAFHIHHDWTPLTSNYDSDIAVLELNGDVTFNNHVQPICLIEPNTYIASLTAGVVVGYGKSEDQSKIHENIPKLVDIPIQDGYYCLKDCDVLPTLSSGRTFCGGSAHGEGVCKGDSGNGMVVSYGNVFYLRGIVSSAKFSAKYECDVYTYAVFTDMLKFNDWVKGF